jgi:hypothetical protein
MGLLDFVEKAPCRTSDPWLFDQTTIDLAQPGLSYCARCKFWQECDTLVAPKKSHYDGVAAGKLWRNGNVLAKLDPDIPNRLIVGEEEEIQEISLTQQE